MNNIFSYSDYRKYLLDYLDHQPKKGRGLRGHWAEAAGCQIAYVSHVLGGTNDFSLEQAELISKTLGHSKDESEFFLLLINKARAGTPSLRQFYHQLLKERVEYHDNIRRRMKIKETLKAEDQAVYYSKWQFSAIHMLLTIPNFQTAQAVATYFSMPLIEVKKYLDFLETRRLISQSSGKYKVEGPFLHVSKDSPLFYHQQTTWRHKAVEVLYRNRPDEIHFASCFSLSEKDVLKIKEMLGQAIEDTTEVIRPSKEEKLYSICLDFFEVR